MISPEPIASRLSLSSRVTGRSARLALKELRETLRDRRTLFTLLLMPLLVYPLLGVILQKVLLTMIAKPPVAAMYSIAFRTTEDAHRFLDLYHQGSQLRESKIPQERIQLLGPKITGKDCTADYLISEGANLVVVFRNQEKSATDRRPARLPPPQQLELVYEEGNTDSLALVFEIQQQLQAVNRDFAERVLAQRNAGLPTVAEVDILPIQLKTPPITQFSLATFVPLMLILMTVTGAVYPAIDLTAGERERGTLEVLVAAPVPRMELLSAKFVAVLTVAMLTAIVNLTAMWITLQAGGLESLVFGERGISWLAMGQILALLFLFAGFFSAVLLAITSFARSFKEAQAYLIPLMLVALAPGIFSLTPGLKMNRLLAMTPLVNIVLLGRDLLQGQVAASLVIAVVTSTILYALLALALAARVFGSDAILYGSQGSVRDWFRRPEASHFVPTLTQVMFALVVLFPAFVVLGSLPGRFPSWPMTHRLALSAGITILLFAGWPALLVWRNHVRFGSAFRMAKALPWFLLVAVLWGGSLWFWVYEVKLLTSSAERLEELRGLFESLKLDLSQVPLVWLLITLAIVPAVCEEWFFRGYLLSGLRTKLSDFQAVLVSAVLFGLFHDLVKDLMIFDRFFTSGMMGLMLGWLAVRSGSLWPGMLLHVLHNGLLLTLGAYQEQLMAWGIGTSAEQHLPWPWLAGSASAILLGAVLLIKFPSKKRHQLPTLPESVSSKFPI